MAATIFLHRNLAAQLQYIIQCGALQYLNLHCSTLFQVQRHQFCGLKRPQVLTVQRLLHYNRASYLQYQNRLHSALECL